MPRPGTQVIHGLPISAVRPGSLHAFTWAFVTTIIALVVKLTIGIFDPAIPPIAPFLIAVLLTTLVAGAAAGVLAAAMGLLSAWATFGPMASAPLTAGGVFVYLGTVAVIIWVSHQYRRLLRRLQDTAIDAERQAQLVSGENEVLEAIIAGEHLDATMKRLPDLIEAFSGDEIAASVQVLSGNGRTLRHVAGSHLPKAYIEAIDGIEIGPAACSCGTAAYRKAAVYVPDIERDPLWVDPAWAQAKTLALDAGLKACWSVPIMTDKSTVRGTLALYHRQTRGPTPQEQRVVELMARLAALAIEYDHGRYQQGLMAQELTHRVKNILSVVTSLAVSTLRGKCEDDALKAFEARLVALSKAQKLSMQSDWSSIAVDDLVRGIVEPFTLERKSIRITGPPAEIPARAAPSISLCLHELCTNAVKYGALSASNGRVFIEWTVERVADGEHKLAVRWSEEGGPLVTPPSRQGFGSRLISHAMKSEPGCDAKITYRPDGLVCELFLPVEEGARGTRKEAAGLHALHPSVLSRIEELRASRQGSA